MNTPHSQTSQEISIACLSWINERLREEVERRASMTTRRTKRRWSASHMVSAISAVILGCLWGFRS